MRVGLGFDVHRLVEGRLLILGGVNIPFEKGLEGHSDADVLTHAIADALLGAAALGDLGNFFPDNDPKYKNANSLELLKEVVKKIHAENYSIANIDAVIQIEKPKLLSYLPQMKERLTQVLGIQAGQLNLKAKRGETLGPIGRGEGVMAQAIALLEKVKR